MSFQANETFGSSEKISQKETADFVPTQFPYVYF